MRSVMVANNGVGYGFSFDGNRRDAGRYDMCHERNDIFARAPPLELLCWLQSSLLSFNF